MLILLVKLVAIVTIERASERKGGFKNIDKQLKHKKIFSKETKERTLVSKAHQRRWRTQSNRASGESSPSDRLQSSGNSLADTN